MQFGKTKPPRGILYDSSFGETIDTVLALALLHGFEGKGKARIACLSTSKANLKSAQLCDVIEKFYASATTGLAAQFFSGMAIGLADGNAPETKIITATLDRKDDAGKPVYAPRIREVSDTAVPEVLMRNALLAQYDGNASMVLAGPATDLARLLALRGAKDLIAHKVSRLVMTEEGLGSDPAAAKSVTTDWPTPVVLVDREVATQLLFPGTSIEKDFAYSPTHPVADAYRAAHAAPFDAPSAALAAMLYAIQPDEGCFKLSEGKPQRLLVNPDRKEAVIQTYVEMASAKPVPRSFRRLKVDENADNKDEQKKQ
jgi:hypothetical protein